MPQHGSCTSQMAKASACGLNRTQTAFCSMIHQPAAATFFSLGQTPGCGTSCERAATSSLSSWTPPTAPIGTRCALHFRYNQTWIQQPCRQACFQCQQILMRNATLLHAVSAGDSSGRCMAKASPLPLPSAPTSAPSAMWRSCAHCATPWAQTGGPPASLWTTVMRRSTPSGRWLVNCICLHIIRANVHSEYCLLAHCHRTSLS